MGTVQEGELSSGNEKRLEWIWRVIWFFIWALRDKKGKACFQKEVMNKCSVKEIDMAFLTVKGS